MQGHPRHRAVAIGVFCLYCLYCCAAQAAPGTAVGENIPWTGKPFLDNPDSFHFVVIGDRTGGHRPGVFARAMQKINLLQPAFVLSVGDLIEGYTEDEERLAAEWNQVDEAVAGLEMPFFYTVGNHDLGNNLMRDLWHRRLGKDYYHFIYRGVLFISLNTEDPFVELPAEAMERQARLEAMMRQDPASTQQRILERSREQGKGPTLPGSVHISQEQIDFVARTLNDNKDVRWTVILMHKPAWRYGSKAFEAIENLLRGRPYTVIAGHEHYYEYDSRHGRDYIDMGTTGGIWLRDGPGRLDHIAWVTIADSGPEVAIIALEGLFDKFGPAGNADLQRPDDDSEKEYPQDAM